MVTAFYDNRKYMYLSIYKRFINNMNKNQRYKKKTPMITKEMLMMCTVQCFDFISIFFK